MNNFQNTGLFQTCELRGDQRDGYKAENLTRVLHKARLDSAQRPKLRIKKKKKS